MQFITNMLVVLSLLLISCDNKEESIEKHVLSIKILPEEGGSVEVLEEASGIPIVDLTSIPEGENIQLKAIPEDNYQFVGWTDGVESSITSVAFVMTEDLTVSALFRKDSGTPVEVYGQLGIEGGQLVDESKVQVQLRGMSLFWSQWMSKYWNQQVIDWLAIDWESSIVRASMGVDANGGFLSNQEEKVKVETVVDAAIDKGIYVIIDWHSHHAEDYPQEAVSFFSEMAKKYGQYPNVIYEVYNEPLDVSWSQTIKPYAEEVIQTIRAKDPDNLILVGTPNWSQDVDDVIGNTIQGTNIAYVFHFYASDSWHYQSLFTKANSAIEAGIPLFVTEWGVSEANGGGDFNRTWTQEWIQFMDKNKLSWCNWAIADKEETSAALKPSANINGNWGSSELSESGSYIRNVLRAHKGYSNPK